MKSPKIKAIYSTLVDAYCPYLDEIVVFDSRGLGHLYYKNGNRRRSEDDIQFRSQYLITARDIIGCTTTLQERESIVREVKPYRVTMYGFIAIVGDTKIKVIIRKDMEGKWYFYSVIPNYVTSPKRDTKNPS